MNTATTSRNGRIRPDTAEIRRALGVLIEPGAAFELRAPKCGSKGTLSGYYNDVDKATADAVAISRIADGTYITLNPLADSLLARRANRFVEWAKTTTTDDPNQVVRRGWLLIDCDVQRPTGISSTDAEKKLAIEKAWEIRQYLVKGCGWPDMVVGDSGNGAHLLPKIDLPNDKDAEALVKGCLEALDAKFSDNRVKVDTTVSNASRIVKLPGTTVHKGDNTPDRPHRVSKLLHVPEVVEVVPWENLEALAAAAPNRERKRTVSSRQFSSDRLDVQQYLSEHNIAVKCDKPYKDGQKWILETCVWCGESDNCAFVIQFGDGALSAGCQHNRCDGKAWHDFRDTVEPGWRERRNERPISDEPPQGFEEFEFSPPEDDAANGSGQPEKEWDRPRKIVFSGVSLGELDKGDYSVEWLIDNFLVTKQPGIVGGPHKALKTLICLDMAISLATCTDFLGRFKVNRAVRVVYMSGEGGCGVLQDYCRRICASKRLTMADASAVIVCERVPLIDQPGHAEAIQAFLMENEAEVVFIDPVYRALSGADAGNLFVMGARLDAIHEAVQAVGATPILLHHIKRNRIDPNNPPDLQDLSWAGFAEHAGQWFMIGRRVPYQSNPKGLHELELNIGGRGGQSGRWAIDVEEGLLESEMGRYWHPEVMPWGGVAEAVQTAKTDRKRAEDETGQRAVIEAMAKLPNGEGVFKAKLYELTGIGERRLGRLLEQLAGQNIVEPCTALRSPGHKTPQKGAYRLTNE